MTKPKCFWWSSPLTGKDNIRWTDLRDQDVVALDGANPLQRKIDDIIESRGIPVSVAYTVQFPTTPLALAEQGLGFGVLPESSQVLSAKPNFAMLPPGVKVRARRIVALPPRQVAPNPVAARFFIRLTSCKRAG